MDLFKKTLRTPCALLGMSVCLGVSLSACTTLPDYHRPTIATPAHFTGAPGWGIASPADGEKRGPWWEIFGDGELNALEAHALGANQTVQKALARLEQARAQLAYQQAGFFPTVSANVSSVPNRTSANLVGKALAGKTVPDHTLGVSVAWEPDLFGRIKDATTGAAAGADASAADVEAVKLLVSSELASDYFAYRSLERQKRLLDDTVRAYGRAYDIVHQQLAQGATDASTLALAETQWENAKTQSTDIDAQRLVLLHAIATLTGEPASTFTLSASGVLPSVPDIPVGVPSQLLERRPDIAAAERRVASANAQIGLARAAFFPSLQLSGAAGLESTFLAPWLTAPSLFWSIGPQLAGTLFDGGQRKAQLSDAKGAYAGAVADYRQTVLLSFQEVEDSLSNLNALAGEQTSQDRAAAAAQQALALTMNRYRGGAVSYLDVVTAQTISLQNARLKEQVDAQRIISSVALIKALGGVWRAAPAA